MLNYGNVTEQFMINYQMSDMDNESVKLRREINSVLRLAIQYWLFMQIQVSKVPLSHFLIVDCDFQDCFGMFESYFFLMIFF